MGEIRKRGNTWWIRYYRNGKREEESAHTDKWDTARDLLKVREGDIAKGANVSAKIGRLRFEDAAADLETDYTINKRSTLDHVKRHRERLAKSFGGRRMAEITGADVRRYIETRQKGGASNATINRELAALRRMFTIAVDGGKLLARPKIKMLDENNVRQGFFETDQFLAVLRYLPAPLQAIAILAYYSGWRSSEIIGKARKRAERATLGEWRKQPLEWSRVDRTARVIRLEVGTTKNKDGREFHYGELTDIVTMVEARWAARAALVKAGQIVPYVFHRKGKPIRSFRKAWMAACKAAGCPGRLVHDFRRTAVRNLERAGVSRSVATQVTGHKTESVYRRYAIVSSGDLADASRKLQAMTGTITGTIGHSGETPTIAKATA